VAREPAIVILGRIDERGQVSLSQLLGGDADSPVEDVSGDIRVALRTAGGSDLAVTRVHSHAIDHIAGVRHFMPVLRAPATGAVASEIVATSRSGAMALRALAPDAPALRTQRVGEMVEARSDAGSAVMLRDATTGDVLAIGWNGFASVRHVGAVMASASTGGRPARTILAR
jgi:hypothetical protein